MNTWVTDAVNLVLERLDQTITELRRIADALEKGAKSDQEEKAA
jgi:hypothetical protein